MEEQEKQVASLKARIATLEGKEELNNGMRLGQKQGGTSVDDWSIKVTDMLCIYECCIPI